MNVTVIVQFIELFLQAFKYACGIIAVAEFEKEVARIKKAIKDASTGSLEERLKGGKEMENGFNKFGKNLWPLVLIPFLTFCKDPKTPLFTEKVEYYNGSSERQSICRKDVDLLCIHTSSESFNNYGCMSHEDMGKIQKYMETLIASCKEWK